MPERYSTDPSIQCLECLTTENGQERPLVFIGTHLPIHQMTYAAYFKKYPEGFTHSATYRTSRQEVSRRAKNSEHISQQRQNEREEWEDIYAAFKNDGLFSCTDMAEELQCSVSAILKAVTQNRLTPDGLATRDNPKSGKDIPSFYLFFPETVAQFGGKLQRKRRR